MEEEDDDEPRADIDYPRVIDVSYPEDYKSSSVFDRVIQVTDSL